MFKNLGDLSVKRSWQEAIGFYIAYLLLGMLLGALTGVIAGITNPENGLELARVAGLVVATIYSVALYFTIYIKKKMSSFIFILLGLVAGVASVFVGNLVALIFVAVLTTRGAEKEVVVS